MSDILDRLNEAFESDSIYVKQAAARDAITEIERLRKEVAEHRDKAAAIETMDLAGVYVVPCGEGLPWRWKLRTLDGKDFPFIHGSFETPIEALLAARKWLESEDV